jgi:hypothetical protein
MVMLCYSAEHCSPDPGRISWDVVDGLLHIVESVVEKQMQIFLNNSVIASCLPY